MAAYDGNQAQTTHTVTGVSLADGLQSLEVLYWDQGGSARLRITLSAAHTVDDITQLVDGLARAAADL